MKLNFRSLFTLYIFLIATSVTAQNEPANSAPAPGPLVAPTTGKQSSCAISEFKSIGLTENAVELRTKKIEAWIQKNGSKCSSDQLLIIYYNRGPWLGNSDSPHIAGLIEREIERKNSEGTNSMYETLDKDGKKVLKEKK
jgi:hypothetical protein